MTATAPTAEPRLQIDSIVRGRVGTLDTIVEGRVFAIARYGVCFLDEAGRQWVSYDGRYEIIGDPRPVKARTDVPERLR